MQTKIILAITAAALVITALAAVTAVQFVGAQNPTSTPAQNSQVPPCISGNTGANAPPCWSNSTAAGYCQTNQGCYGVDAQQAQSQYGCGMGRNSGHGRCW